MFNDANQLQSMNFKMHTDMWLSIGHWLLKSIDIISIHYYQVINCFSDSLFSSIR